MEHIVVSRITQYTEDNNIIVPEQLGFKHGCSCETQLLSLADELTQNLQSGKPVDLV